MIKYDRPLISGPAVHIRLREPKFGLRIESLVFGWNLNIEYWDSCIGLGTDILVNNVFNIYDLNIVFMSKEMLFDNFLINF